MTFSKNLSKVYSKSGELLVIQSYDVLQIKRYDNPEWMDYATIRDHDDAMFAINFLRGKGNPTCGWEKVEGFRIVRNYKPIITTEDLG